MNGDTEANDFRNGLSGPNPTPAPREAAPLLALALDSLNGCAWQREPDGQVRFTSGCEALYGLADTRAGMTMAEFLQRCVHPGDRDAVSEVLMGYLAGDMPEFDLAYRIAGPGPGPHRIRSRGLSRLAEGGARLFFGLDVPAGEARHSDQLVLGPGARQAVIDNFRFGVILADPEGRIVQMNQKAAQFFGEGRKCATLAELQAGFEVSNLEGRPVKSVDGPFRRALQGSFTADMEVLLCPVAGGDQRHVRIGLGPVPDDSGELRLVMVTLDDLTAQRHTEASLRQSEASLRLAAHAARFGTFDAELDAGQLHCSAVTRRILGIARDARLPDFEGLAGFVHADDVERLRAAAVAALDPKGDGRFLQSCRLVRPGGGIRWVQIRGRVGFERRRSQRRPVRVAGTVVDITESRQMQEALSRAQRFEALGQMAGGITHDFNNLLAAISGKLELAMPRIDDDRARELIKGAMNAIRIGASVNRRILSATQKDTLAPQVVDLGARVQGTAALLAHMLGRNIALETQIEPGLWPVLADPGEIDSAVLNLAANASDAMPGGGKLLIAARNRHVSANEAAALHRLARKGDYVCLSVRDTGSGMTPEVARRAVEPYFTTKPPGQGTGLGLTGIRAFMHQSGGFIVVDSVLGAGTEVQLCFPRALGQQTPAFPAQVGEVARHGDGQTVLVVEDDDTLREITLQRLEILGYAVLEARDASEAVDLIRRGENVDLVLSDVVMPGRMSGLDLVKWVAANAPQIRTLLASGYVGAPLDRDNGPEVQRLLKPYSTHELAEAVHRVFQSEPPGAARRTD